MKRRYFLLHFSLIVFLLSTFQPIARCQCLVDYTTYNYFCDLDTLILEAVPVDGVGPFSFIWETGETTQSIYIPLALGDYMVTMTDANGCVSIINCHIKPFPQVLFYPFNQNACEGDTVTLWLDWFRDSIPGATYLWSTGETTWSIELTDDIIWSVTVTDPSTGCEYIIPPNLFDFHPTPYPTIVGPSMLCTGQTVTLSVIGGPFGNIYWWPDDIYAPTLTISQPGTYTVYAWSPEAGYCFHTDTINILPGDIPPPVLIGPPNLCPGQNGTIDITNSSLYSGFLWNNGESTSSIDINQPGTYSVTVTNSSGCTALGDYTIAAGSGASISSSLTTTTCGQSNGSINLTVTPPGSYTFLWSNGSNAEDLINITAGSYFVTVTSPNGCSSTTTINIPDNPIPINITGSITNFTSCTGNTGAIDISINPSGTFYFQWSNGATTEDLSNLAPGIYSVTVTTGINCIASAEYIINNLANLPDIQSITSPSTCGENNGSIDLQIINGESPFIFLWSNGSTTQGLTNVPASTYAVTVTGSNGCSASIVINLPDNNIPIAISSLITSNTSCNSGNGSIDLTITPPGAYTFLWSNGESTEDLINVNGGTYDVTVTMGMNCQQSGSFTVSNENVPYTITGNTSPNTSCQTPNGAVEISISPAGSYSFLWSNGMITEDLQNIPAGTYEISVTNADGCTANAIFTIDNQSAVFSLSGIPVPNTSCIISNGSLDLSVAPAGTYSFIWSNGATSEDIQSLSDGTYSVTVSDVNQCSTTASFLIGNNTIGPIITSLISPETCGTSNASIDLTVSPSGSTFLWSNDSGVEDLHNIPAGNYFVIVTSTNGCTAMDTFDVPNLNSNFSLSAVPISNSSCVSPNGSIDLTISPSGVYTLLWSNGATTEDLVNLASGQYDVTVTDSLNCTSNLIISINNNTVDPLISHMITPSTCSQNNGAIDISVIPSTGNTYNWSNGVNTEDLQNIGPGNYAVTVTDSNGCQANSSFVVPNNNISFSINGIANANTSCIAANGSIDLTVMPAGTYTYAWSNGSLSQDLQNLMPGNYSVTVTNAFNCNATYGFVIDDNTSNPTLSAAITPSTCGLNDGAIDLSISPSGNIFFLWSNGATSEDLADVPPGIYAITATDANGCSATGLFTISIINSGFTISSSIMNDQSCTSPTGSIELTITPAGIYSFTWSNGYTTEDLTNLSSGIYEVTVTDQLNCSASELFSIENDVTLPVLYGFLNPSTCGDNNASIDITVSPSNGNIFKWSSGDTSEDLDNISEGLYTITVTDINGCTSSSSFNVPGSNPVRVTIDADLSALNNGFVTCSLQLSLPLAAISSISWTPPELLSCLHPLCLEQIFTITEQTEIIVMVTDTNGCTGEDSLLLNVEKEFKVYIPNVFSPNGDGSNDVFTIYTNKEIEEIVRLEIFDRWGNQLFVNESFPPNDALHGWDGAYKNQKMNPGVFVYWAVVRYSNGEDHLFKGDVTLLR